MLSFIRAMDEALPIMCMLTGGAVWSDERCFGHLHTSSRVLADDEIEGPCVMEMCSFWTTRYYSQADDCSLTHVVM